MFPLLFLFGTSAATCMHLHSYFLVVKSLSTGIFGQQSINIELCHLLLALCRFLFLEIFINNSRRAKSDLKALSVFIIWFC